MPKPLFKKIKPLTLLLLILTSTIITLSFLFTAKAETTIISITPTSGHVGTTVRVIANISTSGKEYTIQFDGKNVTSGKAKGNSVNASFNVPHAPEGPHNVTLIDATTKENDTAVFTILISYSFEPFMPEPPIQVQEGGSVTISVNMTGGKSNYTYPKIEVQTPSENLIYKAINNVTTNATGDFYDNFNYPNDFKDANTNFTGVYKILFNATVVGQFFIGVTDRSEYHRGDIVNIKAVDYPPNNSVTLTIKFNGKVIDTIKYNATNGLINVNWNVPLNATIGSYTLSISPVPDSKEDANDTQIFKVPGFETKIFTLNLARETVPNVFVKVHDELANMYYNTTSNKDGLATVMLERGSHNCKAFLKEVRVGEVDFMITEEKQVNFTCRLTSLNIKVIDDQNVRIPEVSISLSYNYTTNLDEPENRTGTESGMTNATGILHLRALLPNVTYKVNASRYGKIFNQNNDTIQNLPAIAYFDVTIPCPARTLRVNVVDAYNKPITNAVVKAQELMGGLPYSNSTQTDGKAVLRCTFGRYFVKVYSEGTLLNETVVDLFNDQDVTIQCVLYNLPIFIRVVDYFGQPIQDVNVALERDGLLVNSYRTGSDGMARFTEIGGNLTIKAYLADQNQPIAAFSITVNEARNETNPIEVRLGKYMILAGFLIEISQFTTVTIIAATVILILLIEIYGRKRLKPKKASS